MLCISVWWKVMSWLLKIEFSMKIIEMVALATVLRGPFKKIMRTVLLLTRTDNHIVMKFHRNMYPKDSRKFWAKFLYFKKILRKSNVSLNCFIIVYLDFWLDIWSTNRTIVIFFRCNSRWNDCENEISQIDSAPHFCCSKYRQQRYKICIIKQVVYKGILDIRPQIAKWNVRPL
jgi:hypothetical protein